MEDGAAINKAFNELVMAEQLSETETEARIESFSTHPQLVVAVYDELIARIEHTFPFSGELLDVYEKKLKDANERVVAITEHLRHEYGLSEEDARCALELARLDVLETRPTTD